MLFGCIRDENTDDYVGIIVERTNPKYQSFIDDFNESLETFHASKPEPRMSARFSALFCDIYAEDARFRLNI